LEGVGCALGGRPVVAGIDLSLHTGEFFALLGPSGCGKTTLLRLIGGYLSPGSGRVILRGEDVTDRPPERRDVGMVFQSYALFPHLSARENVAFGLEMRGIPRRECQQRVEEMLDRVGLATAERGRKPTQLSGGQQQRVALARALVIEPRLLLLDEPLANLDRRLREQLRTELRHLQQRTGVATLLVTHDQEEALALADRLGVMSQGRLLQVDAPRELYRHPVCPFVACFLGDANLLRIERVENQVMVLQGGWRVTVSPGADPVPGKRVMVRPEQILLGAEANDAIASLDARVIECTFLGADLLLTVTTGDDLTLRIRTRNPRPDANLGPGATVRIGLAEPPWVIPREGP
jgi:ABC-type Fe3+/spermidine/putrescine transport system ATPase subunit